MRRRIETTCPDHPVAARLGPEIQRSASRASTPAAQKALLEEYVRVLARVAAEHPLLLLIDDLHHPDRARST